MGLFSRNDTTDAVPVRATSGVSPLLMGDETELKRERIALGYLGAFLFSLGGVVVYFLLYQINFFAAFSGLVSVLLANLGYRLFSGKKNSRHGVIASIIMLVISIALAEYCCLAFACYQAFNEYGSFTFAETMEFMPELLKDSEMQGEIVKELLIAYGLGVLGAFGTLRNNFRASKAAADPGFNPDFNTGSNPDFNTGSNPGFNTGSNPGFNTGSNPGFNTGSNPDSNTGSNPDSNTGSNPDSNTGV